MTATVIDPFALPEDAKIAKRASDLSGGRYRFPNRDGSHKPYGWQRVTNLVGAYADQYSLQRWEQEQIILGLHSRPDLFQEVLLAPFGDMTKEDRGVWVANFVERCKSASGANIGRDHGNHRHAIYELTQAGKPIPLIGRRARVEFELLRLAMLRNELRSIAGMQERRVLIEELEACGTLDDVLEDLRTGIWHVGDLKTQKRFYTSLEIAAQLGCYSHAVAMWDVDSGRWVDMPKVSLDIGMVLWIPRVTEDGEPRVEVFEVDVAKGYETAKLAYRIVRDRSEAKSKKGRRMWLREAPPISDMERYAAYFAGVDTLAEGRKLTIEAKEKGLWGEELAACAVRAFERISPKIS